MPVPAVRLNHAPGIRAQPKPDKGLYIWQQRKELLRVSKERIRPRLAAALVSMDAQRYFFVDWRKLNRRKHPDGEANALVRDFSGVFDTLTKPRNDYLRGFDDYVAMDLFNIARLNECVSSDLLDGTPSAAILESLGMRNGLPDKCVTPSLRLFSRSEFLDRIVRPHRDALTPDTFRAALSMPGAAKLPLTETVFAGGRTVGDLFTISTATAKAIFDAVNAIVPNSLPALDVLFPFAEARYLSYKREPHLRPLDPRDGNVI